jgi:hypothetical protein
MKDPGGSLMFVVSGHLVTRQHPFVPKLFRVFGVQEVALRDIASTHKFVGYGFFSRRGWVWVMNLLGSGYGFLVHFFLSRFLPGTLVHSQY